MDNNSNNNSANNAAAPAAAKSPPGSSAKESVSAIDQRHLNEFNEWLARWIGYQGLLALYWKKRAQYEEQQSLAAGQGVVGGESKGEDKWDLRFQELCEYKVRLSWVICSCMSLRVLARLCLTLLLLHSPFGYFVMIAPIWRLQRTHGVCLQV